MEDSENKIATLGRFTYERALLIQSILQSNDIENFTVVQKSELPAFGSYVEIKVKYPDIPQAMQLLEDMADDFEDSKEKAVSHALPVKRILVPIDYSSNSMHAARFAMSLAGKFKAEVKLLHVFYNPVIEIAPYNENYSYQVRLSELMHGMESNAREQMDKTSAQLKEWGEMNLPYPVKLSTALANGVTSIEIQIFAESYWPSFIVVGSRGITKKSLGSVGSLALRLFEKSGFPVISIPEGSPANIESIKSLLFATDFDQTDISVIERLIFLTQPFNIQLHCVHISVGQKKLWDPVKMNELQEIISRDYPEREIILKNIVSDSVMNGLETYVRNNDIDMISVVSHKKGFLEKFFSPSITNLVFGEMNKSMLVFHALQT